MPGACEIDIDEAINRAKSRMEPDNHIDNAMARLESRYESRRMTVIKEWVHIMSIKDQAMEDMERFCGTKDYQCKHLFVPPKGRPDRCRKYKVIIDRTERHEGYRPLICEKCKGPEPRGW